MAFFPRTIFWLAPKMSLFISLERTAIITNQGCEHLSAAAINEDEKKLRTWAKYQEKYSSKWGVPRLSEPLIKMLTPLLSALLHIFRLACRCELWPCRARADTCLNSSDKWGHVCRCDGAPHGVAFKCEAWVRTVLWSTAILSSHLSGRGLIEH